ncbi:MAG: cytochrome P450 [Nocardiopsaceae bacterium]|nr:cytochrome P450 [Nocardiopsaceae bacterium]
MPSHPPETRPVPLYDPTAISDYTALWAKLLAEYPGGLVPVQLEPDPNVTGWLTITHAMTRHVMESPEFTRDARHWAALQAGRIPEDSPTLANCGPRPNALTSEGDLHLRYRSSLVNALEANAKGGQGRVLNQIGLVADRIIDTFCEAGRVDLIPQYASYLPMLALCRLVGLNASEGVQLCTQMGRIWDGGPETAHAYGELLSLLRTVARTRRRNPGNDIASHMINDGLTDEEVTYQVALVFATSQDPVAHLIGNTLAQLLRDFSAEHAGLFLQIPETINTILWRDPPIRFVPGRWTTEPVELGGYRLPPGELLVLGFGPAHYDLLTTAAVDPRTSQVHLGWGAGRHRCPVTGRDTGLALAEVGVARLLRRLPDIKLEEGVDPDRLPRRLSVDVSGLSSLPVRFTPTAPIDKGDPWRLSSLSGLTPAASTTESQHERSGLLARLLRLILPGN